jgi:hypothetical protein
MAKIIFSNEVVGVKLNKFCCSNIIFWLFKRHFKIDFGQEN